MQKILITTSSFNLDTDEVRALQGAGYEVVLNPHKRRLTEAEVSELLTPDIVGMIAGVEPLTSAVIDGAQGLRAIARCGIGMDSVDIDAVKSRGIALSNTPDAPTRAVAELSVGLMLDCLRSISLQDRAIRGKEWVRPMGGLLGERTIGLVGFGRIGKKVAEYVSGFGAKIVAYDSFVKGDDRLVSLDELLAQSDIVSLHMPYDKDNHHIIDAEALAKMKQGAILINTARGGLVDEDALAVALKNGQLSCAALDVFEDEPYKGVLAELDNVVLTAHVGSYAKEARIEQEALAATNLLADLLAQGKQVRHA